MNKAYKVIWSKVKGCYVVVSELAKERGKNNSRGKQALLAGIVMGTLLGGAFLPAGTVFAANDIHYVAVGVDTSKAIEARDNQGGSGTPSPVDPTANYDFPQTSTINFISIGAEASAWANGAVAMGFKTAARGEYSTALGTGSGAYSKGDLALGWKAYTGWNEPNKIAIGTESTALKENGISIGNKSKTWYHNAIAIGNEAETGNKGGVTSNDSIAIGNKAKIQGQKNVAIGSGVTVGTGSTSSGSSYVVAIGSESKAYDTDSVVIGGHSEVHENATVVGNRSKADMQSVALGSSVEAGKWSVAIGLKSKAKNHAIAMGMDSDVAGEYSIAIGEEAKTPLDKSVSIGYQAKAETQESLAIGDRAVVYGENITEAAVSTAIGSQAKVYGKNAIALGGSANVGDIWQKQMADGGTAIGSSSNAAMENATAIGYKSIAYGKDAVTIGAGTRADIVEGGVALGSESNVGSYVDSKYGIAGKVGYDPLGTDANGTSTWKSTKAAVSVGNQQKDITRQIINVAAGTDNTDAVNVAQLKSLGRKAWNDLAEAKDELGGRIATNTGNITKLSTRVGTNERDIGRLKTDVSTNDTRIRYLYSNMPFRHFISVNEEGTNTTLPNYKNEGAKKAGSIAIGVNTTAYGEDAVALGGNLFAWGQSSVIVGESSDNYTGGVTAKEGQFDQSIILGSNNTIFAQSAENGGREDKIIGNMNRVEESHGTFVRGTGNMVYDAYNDEALTDEDKQKEQDFLDPIDGGDPKGLFQKGRSHVTVEGDGNMVAGSLYTQVSGVGNEVSNSQPDENGPSTPRVTYNIVTGNRNTVVDSSHNLIMGDNHELENVNGNIIIGSLQTKAKTTASNVTILGNDANVSVDGGVALGTGSVASTAAGVFGYDPATGEASATDNATWKSVKGAVSVGNADATRQITGVAAGSEDTDAVNVAQLKALNKQVTEGAVHYFSVKADDSANPVGTNWNNDGAKSTGSIAVGQKARTLELEVEPWKTPEKISSDHAVALGSDASAAGNGSVAIGKNAVTGTRFATESLGGGASLTTAHNIAGDGAVAVGDSSQAGTEGSVAIGRKATAGYYGALLNHTTKEKKSYGIAIGDGAKAIGNYNRYSRNDNRDDAGLAVGRQAYAAGNGTIAMGYKAHAANTQNIIIGSNASTKALFKNDGEETVHPISSVGIGSDVVVKGRYSVALGPGASVGNGKLNLPESTSFMDFGGVALGYKSQVDRPGSVGLGSWTRPWRQVDPEHPEQPIDEQTKYADGKKVVAPFSGQKLYFKDDIGGAQVYHAMGSNSVVNGVVSVGGVYEGLGGRKIPFLRQIINVADGTEDTDAVNLRQLKAVNADVTTDIKALQDGFTVSNAAGEKQNITLGGDTKQNIKFQGEAGKIDVDVAHASDGATVTVKANANLGKNIDLSSNTTVTNITNNLNRGFELRAGTESTGAKIALDGNETPAIRFDVAEADKGLTVTREGNTVKYGIDGSKIDLAENAAITNITNNLSQASAWKLQVNGKNERVIGKDNVVNFVAGSYTEVTADGNDVKIGLNKAAKDKLDKVDTLEGQIKANKVQVTGDAVTGVKVADKKEADGSTTYTVSLDKKIQVGGVAVNGKDGKGEVTGLTNTSLNVAGFATSKRAATEEQLQLAMDQMSANAKITTVESGDENIVVNKTKGQNENKYTVALNKNLNVDSLNAGGTQVNKDGITLQGKDGKPGVAITKDGINAGGQTIRNVKPGEKIDDAATVGQLKDLAGAAGNGLNELGNQIGRLDGRVNKVGAGAAALAALHPVDFDADDKLDVAGGLGPLQRQERHGSGRVLPSGRADHVQPRRYCWEWGKHDQCGYHF